MLKLSRIPSLKYIYYRFIKPYIALNDIKKFFFKEDNNSSSKNLPDLILASNSIPNFNCSFILDLEIVNALGGYDSKRLDKEKIKRQLSDNNCKAIVCWYDISKEALIKTIDCIDFKDKIKVIPFGFKSDKFSLKKTNKKTIDLLFISSINNPQDFEQKGGIIALETYSQIASKYPNTTFTLRSYVPKWAKEKYSSLPGIKFIEEFLSEEDMKKLFLNSDFLLQPVPGLQLLLEAMNYSLPIVCFDAWMIGELVRDKKTGFVIDGSSIFGSKKHIEKYVADFNLNYFKLFNKHQDLEIIKEFTQKSSILIKNKPLRKKMGRNAKSLLSKNGPYSFDKMIKSHVDLINDCLKEK